MEAGSNLSQEESELLAVLIADEEGIDAQEAPLSSLEGLKDLIKEYQKIVQAKKHINFLLRFYKDQTRLLNGTQSLVNALAQEIGEEEHIVKGNPVTQVSWDDRQHLFEIQFQDNSLVRSKTVIMAIPFSVLRGSSSILEDTSLGLTPGMRTYIDTLSYGTNSKVIVPSGNLRLTYGVGLQGATAWSSVNQDLHILLGGKAGKKVTKATASVYVDPFLKATNMTEADTSNITVVNWSKDPFAQGSYSARKAGDVCGVYDEMNDMDDRLTRIATALYDKGFFFIGEHLSFKHKEFMEGAVQSGKAIAAIVAQRLQQ